MRTTPAPDTSADVIIIGGGLAGLSAADGLRDSDLRVTLLESADRLGGRTYGQHWDAADRAVDMGGTWLLPSFAQTFALLAELGISTVESPDAVHWLTHFRPGPAVQRELTTTQLGELTAALDSFAEIIEAATEPLTAEAVFQAAAATDWAPSPLIEDWQRAMQRYLAGAPLDAVDAAHLLLDVADIADPEHYHTQVSGTTQALVDALSARVTATVALGKRVTAVRHDQGEFRVETADGGVYSAARVIVAAPLNCLADIEFDDQLLGSFAPLIADGHAGASHKDWLVIDGIPAHFRVFASHGPYGYFRSEAILADGGTLCVGLTPSAELPLPTEALEQTIREHYFPGATIRARLSHDWNADPHARGTWFVPRPGQYAALPELTTGHPQLWIVGGDVDAAFPGMIEGAVLSGQRAAAAIHQPPAAERATR